MGSESEQCVDILLVKINEIEILLADPHDNDGNKIKHAREVLQSTQAFVNENKPIIPGYSLRKISEALRKLEKYLEESDKAKLQFKFKHTPKPSPDTPTLLNSQNQGPKELVTSTSTPFFGFKDKSGEHLTLEDVDTKDISLINLNECHVNISGLANTIYIKNLNKTSCTICLACRAITVANCTDCKFKFVCQQLRIDSTFRCHFETYTSVRSMLESSKELIFSRLNTNSLEGLTSSKIDDLFKRSNFDISQNNWKCIDDFDWLSPTTPSKNYTLIED